MRALGSVLYIHPSRAYNRFSNFALRRRRRRLFDDDPLRVSSDATPPTALSSPCPVFDRARALGSVLQTTTPSQPHSGDLVPPDENKVKTPPALCCPCSWFGRVFALGSINRLHQKPALLELHKRKELPQVESTPPSIWASFGGFRARAPSSQGGYYVPTSTFKAKIQDPNAWLCTVFLPALSIAFRAKDSKLLLANIRRKACPLV